MKNTLFFLLFAIKARELATKAQIKSREDFLMKRLHIMGLASMVLFFACSKESKSPDSSQPEVLMLSQTNEGDGSISPSSTSLPNPIRANSSASAPGHADPGFLLNIVSLLRKTDSTQVSSFSFLRDEPVTATTVTWPLELIPKRTRISPRGCFFVSPKNWE